MSWADIKKALQTVMLEWRQQIYDHCNDHTLVERVPSMDRRHKS